MEVLFYAVRLNTSRLQASGLFSDGVRRGLDIVSGLQFTSSNPTVVTVDNKGTLTALNLGRATITIKEYLHEKK
jgi:hypothetical protein